MVPHHGGPALAQPPDYHHNHHNQHPHLGQPQPHYPLPQLVPGQMQLQQQHQSHASAPHRAAAAPAGVLPGMSSGPPSHRQSPVPADYYSPASTSYLPTPPLVHSHHPHHPQHPHRAHGPSAANSPDRRSSDTYSIRRDSDSLRSIADHRRGSEPLLGTPPEDDGRVGVEDPTAERSYNDLKVLGDGSFGTVWLCDWHSQLKPDVLLSAMQCGAGARPEWAGKRLVALKRMKRVWEGGWRQARNLGELVSLRSIPPHPAVIPLYDAFISPRSRELYFVFECMEGNLYQLTKSRKGRPLAAGLIASCFHQVVSGLYHIHQHGYFHRDMKPENLLVTTTGLCDYLSSSALNEIHARRASGQTDEIQLGPGKIEKDVQVIVKLADFGLARAIESKPPYTEYVSTRWYRAPEVLLRSTEYGAPVDMWALGTILAEMVNLKPLFPGVSEIDQVYRICDTLGDPSTDYGYDERGRAVGGGVWTTGTKLAKNVGFSFPKSKPVNFRSLFPEQTPQSLIDCIGSLLRYNPKYRMTSAQCMDHAFFHETLPHLQHVPPLPKIPFSQGQPLPHRASAAAHANANGQQQQQQPPPPQVRQAAPQQLQQQPQPRPPQPQQQPPQAQAQAQVQVQQHHHLVEQPRPPVLANSDMRTLPPPVDIQTPDSARQGGSNPPQIMFHRGPMARQDSGPFPTSALVHQLRELDLPTDDLASYGQRRWADEQALSASRPSIAVSTHYDGSIVGSANSSNPSYSNLNPLSATNLQRAGSQQHLPPTQQQHAHAQQQAPTHVAAYVQQQQMQAYQQSLLKQVTQSTPNLSPSSTGIPSAPRAASQSTMALASEHLQPTPPQVQSSSSKLAPAGKKKKWGLSAVFGGGGDKNASSAALLPSVDETAYPNPTSSSSSLKRTQSGHYADERGQPQPQPQPVQTLDPKKAKKEAEMEKRELARAKRDAAERAQQERARAVLRKRNQMIADSNMDQRVGEIEYRPTGGTYPAQSVPMKKTESHQSNPGSMRGYATAHGAQSSASVASARSNTSGVSPYGATLGTYEGSRHKARKTTEDDDHSSIGRASIKSRSMLSVGTVDSDAPSRRDHYHGSSLASAQRHPPVQQHSTSSLMTHSTASLESQLASQLARQATVASVSESSLSLGRRAGRGAGSQLQLDPSAAYHSMHIPPHEGHGMQRHGSNQMLQSLDTWPEGAYQEINPIFRVPTNQALPEPQQQHPHQQTTLPPFSAIARVADSHGHRSSQ